MFQLPHEATQRQTQMLEQIASALDGIRHELRGIRAAMDANLENWTVTFTAPQMPHNEPQCVTLHGVVCDAASATRAASEREQAIENGGKQSFPDKTLS